jgi:DedD protein
VNLNRPLDDDDLPARGYSSQRLSGADRPDPDHADREISLGTPTILGIFFALALVCACFFGFGYTMGRRSAQSAQSATASLEANSAGNANAPKPAAGSQSGQRVAPAPQPAGNASASPAPVQTATLPLTSSAVSPADRMIIGDKPPTPAPQPATSSPQPAGSFVVQVAAVSSQDVADILLASLRKKGYTVAIHHEPQDKLLHVQIGPFTDRKDAEAMRQRVLADGFNAIVK